MKSEIPEQYSIFGTVSNLSHVKFQLCEIITQSGKEPNLAGVGMHCVRVLHAVIEFLKEHIAICCY